LQKAKPSASWAEGFAFCIMSRRFRLGANDTQAENFENQQKSFELF
jgi:hypothetical protein